MNVIKGVIFDMDGLLLDTEIVSFNCYKELLEKYGYLLERDFYLTLIGRNARDSKQLMKNYYKNEEIIDKIYEEKILLMDEKLEKEGLNVKNGAYELISYLKENNYKIAVATSTSRIRAIKLLEKANLKDKFDYIICGDEVKNSKPDPEIYLKAAMKIGINPENCLVLEDSSAGIKAAKRAGMTAINIPDMKEPDDEIKKLSFKVCRDLFEVKNVLK